MPWLFQLAEADDRVGVVKIGGVGKAPRHKGLRKGGLFLVKIAVQLRSGGLSLGQTGDAVDVLQNGGRKAIAGAVADHNGRAAAPEQARQRREKRGMGRGGGIGLHG